MLLALRRVELGSITWNDVILRRTMRSGPARLGTPVVVAELCLGHKQGGVIGIYYITATPTSMSAARRYSNMSSW